VTLERRIEKLEDRAGSREQVIVVRDERDGMMWVMGGEEISEAELQELKETHDVVLIHIVEEGDDELAETN